MIELGSLRGAYGVRGWVHVAAESPDAQVLRSARRWRQVGSPATRFDVTAVRRHGSGWVAKLAGVDDPERAEQLRGTRIAVDRADFPPLPEGEYYWIDLIGARVVNREGECLGDVRGLRSNGMHDVLVIGSEDAMLLVPLVEDYVDRVERQGSGPEAGGERVIRVDWQRDWS